MHCLIISYESSPINGETAHAVAAILTENGHFIADLRHGTVSIREPSFSIGIIIEEVFKEAIRRVGNEISCHSVSNHTEFNDILLQKAGIYHLIQDNERDKDWDGVVQKNAKDAIECGLRRLKQRVS